MLNEEYRTLINKISSTGQYIDKLASIESDMSQDVQDNKIDIIVHEKLGKCIDEINAIYINNGATFEDNLEVELNEIDWHNKSVDNEGTHKSEVV